MTRISIVRIRNMRRSKRISDDFPCSYSFNDATQGTSYHIRIGTQAERVGRLVMSAQPHEYRQSMFMATVEQRLGINYITTLEVI